MAGHTAHVRRTSGWSINGLHVTDSGMGWWRAVLGSEGGEIMTMIQIAMLGKLAYPAMTNAIFTHPLLAEGLNTLFAMFDA